jgi:hypothetical protein
MTDLTERLRLIAAWRTRGGPTPKQACPSVYETTTEAATTIETLTQENAGLREALEECAEELGNEIRARYSSMVDHPAMKLRYDRDMASVYAARKALGGGDE